MTLRRLSVLQWLGLLAGAGAWGAQFLTGYWVTETRCQSGGVQLTNDVWQAAAMATAGICVLAAEAAAVTVLRRIRRMGLVADGPPFGRIRFFAIAAALANVIFLMIVLLSGLGALAGAVCRQA
jgi:hypothetical protein